MTEQVRLVNLPRQMLSGFPGSFGVQGEAKPTTKATDVLDAGHGTQICPSVPFRRRHWKRLRLTSSAGEVKKAGGQSVSESSSFCPLAASKRKLQLLPSGRA